MQSLQWIRNPAYDLVFIFGGALLTLLLPLIAMLNPEALVPLLFWGWLILFEGTHFWATFSRTYLDRAFYAQNRSVLLGSLLFFLFPALAVGLTTATHNPLYVGLYGFFIFSWSLYHNTRQHYGFVSIYNRKAGAEQSDRDVFRWAIYLATFGPMAHFFLSYKLKADFADAYSVVASPLILSMPAVVAAFSLLCFSWLGWKVYSERARGGPDNRLAYFYILTCALFYNTMFFIVAPQEPIFNSPANFGQTLMVIAIMNSLFHNIQYHAIVWHYSDKRYTPDSGTFFGVARLVNSKLWSYCLAAVGFSTFFTWIFWHRGEVGWFGLGRAQSLGNLAYIVYFGIVGHHFYLDQKIWRVGRSKELRQYLT